MKYEIWGDICPVLTIEMKKDDVIYTQQGGMSWMTDKIAVDTSLQSEQKTFKDYLKRSKEFAAAFRALEDHQMITISATRAGKILEIDIDEDHKIIGRRSSFLCTENDVKINTIVPAYNKRIPKGSGYYLQSYEGKGKLFIELGGSVKVKELAEGEKLVIESGNLAAWESTVSVTEQFYRNFRSMLLEGEGTLICVAEGPGKIWLQSTPVSELAKRVIPFIKDVD